MNDSESESGLGLGFLIATVVWAIFLAIIIAITDFVEKNQSMNNATIAPSLEEINKFTIGEFTTLIHEEKVFVDWWLIYQLLNDFYQWNSTQIPSVRET